MGALFTTPVRQASSVGHRRAAYLSGFRAEHSDLTLALRRLRSSKPQFSPAQLERIAASGVAEMETLAAQSAAQFERLSQARLQAYRAHRAFQDEHGLTAPAKMPDMLSTLLVLMICGLAEAAFTAVLMITGGKMTILEGFGYGATVAAVNLAVGTLAGFLPLRFTGYKRTAPNPEPRDAMIRAVAWASFMCALSVLGVLHFAAARVRVSGSATQIFDFSHVSFGSTFADYYALGVMAIGTVGAVLAIYKGFNGFSDPVPGYSESRREAGERIDACGHEVELGALDTLALILAQRSEEAQALLASTEQSIHIYRGEREALSRRIADHNNLIETACDDLRLAAEDQTTRQSFIAGQSQTPEALRLEELKALALPNLPDDEGGLPSSLPHADAFTRLQAAHDAAASIIRSAFNAFLTDLTRFDFIPQDKEMSDEHTSAAPLPAFKNGNGHAPPLRAGN